MRQISLALLAAAALFGAVAAGCTSCGGRGGGADRVDGRADTLPRADTLALVEGLRLYREGLFEPAREQLMVSVHSQSAWIRAESFLYLNALEMDLGNWDAARPWLEKYHTEAMKLFRQTVDAEERISVHREQTVRSIVALRRLVVGIVCAVVAMAAVVVLSMRRRGRAGTHLSFPESEAPELPDISEWRRHLERVEIFTQRPIWAEIARLAAQKPGRDARVLNHSQQEVLDGELSEIFSEFVAELRAACPSLTAGDVKLCCLSLAGLSSFGRALCFGSIETNIIKQRKHKIKRKLATDAAGRRLFEFIFSPRDAGDHPDND